MTPERGGLSAEAVISLCCDALIRTHPSAILLREQLESGELDQRMEFLGERIFDRYGRYRALIAARDYLRKAEA